MAARKRTWTPDVVRERIRVSMLRHRLENHVLGKIEMSPTQIKAAEILLKKCLPDLTSTDMTIEGEIGSYTAIPVEQRESDPVASAAGTAARSH